MPYTNIKIYPKLLFNIRKKCHECKKVGFLRDMIEAYYWNWAGGQKEYYHIDCIDINKIIEQR